MHHPMLGEWIDLDQKRRQKDDSVQAFFVANFFVNFFAPLGYALQAEKPHGILHRDFG